MCVVSLLRKTYKFCLWALKKPQNSRVRVGAITVQLRTSSLSVEIMRMRFYVTLYEFIESTT